MLSMTGFGSASRAVGGRGLTVEVRSLNAKLLDLSFRLPSRWERLETAFASLVRAKVRRGKVVVTVYWETGGSSLAKLSRSHYRAVARQLRMLHPGPLARADVLSVVGGETCEEALSPDGMEGVSRTLLEEAVDRLVAAREAEGRALGDELRSRLDAVERWMTEIEGLLPEVAQETHRRLEAALERLGQVGADVLADPERIAREVALLLIRSDAREEVVRTRAHLAAFRERMAGPGPHGRMLEFLIQETQRELNTLGSKTSHVEITQRAMQARAVLDQMREQVANVE